MKTTTAPDCTCSCGHRHKSVTVLLGTIAVEGGRATVRYAPGRCRVECVLPDGTVEMPEDSRAATLEEARRTAEALWGRDLRTWDWQPRQ